jgi:hypothetical protein
MLLFITSYECNISQVPFFTRENHCPAAGIKCTNRSASSFLGVIAFAINVVPVQVFTGCSAA